MQTGQLVRLRVLEPEDADTLWTWHNDPEVMRWMGDVHAESLATIRKRWQDRPANSFDKVVLGVETLEGRLVGVTVLRDAEPETGDAELDIYLGAKDTWGKGYATEAMRLICRYGFERMRLHRITLWVVAENAAARRVYEKVGFVEEGRTRESFRRDGKWHDMIVMGLLEGELR